MAAPSLSLPADYEAGMGHGSMINSGSMGVGSPIPSHPFEESLVLVGQFIHPLGGQRGGLCLGGKE